MSNEVVASPMGEADTVDSQTDGQTVTTIDALTEAVADSVVGRVAPLIGDLSRRMDELESVAGSAAGRLQVEGLAERLDGVESSLSAQVQAIPDATLQAGAELGPVIGEEVGPVIIELIGQLLDLTDGDGDGSSDVVPLVSDIRESVQDISGALVHPAMTTEFSDYTVLEALLLLLVVGWFVRCWLRILGGGFFWLK